MNRDAIEQLAGDLLCDAGYTTPPVDPCTIARRSGAHVRLDPAMPVSMAGLVIPGWLTHLIVVNEGHTANRRRFSVGHELGHLFLHCADGTGCLLSAGQPYYELQPEREANFFAAMLLMPRAWVEIDWRSGLVDPRHLARRYRVSPQAMHFQLCDLGLIPSDSGPPEWVDRVML